MIRRVLSACALALAVATPAAPQATVAGTVRDAETGRPLPGVAVVLADLHRSARTDDAGAYEITGVAPGPQHLAVGPIGYGARILHLLVPREGRLEIDVALRPEPVELEGLVVSPRRPVRGLDPGDSTAFPDRGLSLAALRGHPLLAEPDAFQALAGGEVVIEPETPSGISIRGGATDQTAYLLDGVPILNPYHAAGLFSAWNPDALSEIGVSGAAPSPELPDALSGVVSASTREPGHRLGLQGAVTTTQARVTADGPAGIAGASYLVSARSGFPGPLSPDPESIYLTGETGDVLTKIEVPSAGGRFRVLLYDSENEIETLGGVPEGDAAAPGDPRNRFGWTSRSVGVGWDRTWDRYALEAGAWSASTDADSWWSPVDGAARLATRRHDRGIRVSVVRRGPGSTTSAGFGLRGMETGYDVRDGSGDPAWDAAGTTPVARVYVQHQADVTEGLRGRAGASVSLADGRAWIAPRAWIEWTPGAGLAWSLAYARSQQFSQSLRNPESLAGQVFPADLFVGAGIGGVPVATGDQVVLAAEWRPAAGVRLGAQAFARAMDHVLLVAPEEDGPFATGAVDRGRGAARGVSVDLSASGARYGLVASYGWQRVRLDYGSDEFAPRHGPAHVVDAGLLVYPSATSSLRLAVRSAFGRSGAPVMGPFEWEPCSLLDEGCEFAGSPRVAGPLGGDLPAYARVDLGGRKHWHASVAGRDVLIGVFGTISNLLGRHNVLTYVTDPDGGDRKAIQMVGRAPVVVGFDWRF